jgi:hypothetical protein
MPPKPLLSRMPNGLVLQEHALVDHAVTPRQGGAKCTGGYTLTPVNEGGTAENCYILRPLLV